jgi:hypothetical protein
MLIYWEVIFLETLKTVLASIGGGVIVLVAILKWLSKIIEEKLKLVWQQQNQKEIEIFKAYITNSQDIFKSSLTQFSSGHQCSQEKRLKAIDELWETILAIRSFVGPIVSFYDVLLPKEYMPVLEKDPDAFLVSKINLETINEFMKRIESIEKQRPYLGEYIWGLFFTYRAFMLRMTFVFQSSKEKGQIIPWYEDKHMLDMLKTSIGKDYVDGRDFSVPTATHYAIAMFEQKILIEVNKLISGEYASESNYKEAKRLLELVEKERMNTIS